MTQRIFRSICIVAVTVFISSIILIMNLLYGYFSAEAMKNLKEQAVLIGQGVEQCGSEYFDGLEPDDFRITWIDHEGNVLYDSQANADAMENHLEREEVRQALKTGEGESSRYSATLTERLLYAAVLLDDGSIIRASSAQLTVFTLLMSLSQPILIVVVIGLGLSLFLASRLSKRIIQPLNAMNPDNPQHMKAYPELDPLITRLTCQQNQLHVQEEELKRKQHELNTAMESMQEGMVLLDESGKIISINGAARRILGITDYCVGKDILLVTDCGMLPMLQKASAGGHVENLYTINGMQYQINVSPIMPDGNVAGMVLLIFDISEKQKNEQLRREFTANVSHELKTPLHTISGYAEMLASDMVSPDDVKTFSSQILSDTRRMTALIEDIIRLSQMDEGAGYEKREPADLYALAKQTADNLQAYAAESDITLTVSGESAVISGIPQLLTLLIHNLCDNAIKYNRQGGSVNVNVEKAENSVVLSVSDTGIGIPEDQQERVFERFYRVNKSRSRELGGTGLGLSIVKHAALLHSARIEMNSVPDEGTCIQVLFPG